MAKRGPKGSGHGVPTHWDLVWPLGSEKNARIRFSLESNAVATHRYDHLRTPARIWSLIRHLGTRIWGARYCSRGMTPFVFDVHAAYLHADAEEDMRIPISYPKGRKRFKVINGVKTELFALVVKNLYGLPTAGRHWSKERDSFTRANPAWTAVQMIAVHVGADH